MPDFRDYCDRIRQELGREWSAAIVACEIVEVNVLTGRVSFHVDADCFKKEARKRGIKQLEAIIDSKLCRRVQS